MSKLNVGDVIRFTEKARNEHLEDVTIGKLYVIAGRDWIGDVYWEEKGVAFTQEELDKFNGVAKPVAGPVVLPAVAPTNKPTPSPLKPTPKAPAVTVFTFDSREQARKFARSNGKSVKDNGVNTSPRWSVK